MTSGRNRSVNLIQFDRNTVKSYFAFKVNEPITLSQQ